jgi:hypothetical protein
MKTFRRIILLISALMLAGCGSTQTPDTLPKPVMVASVPLHSMDAAPGVQLVFQLEVYVLSVPAGTLSGNEEFWKRIDETALDPATYDLLYRSGVRVGEAPLAELSALDTYIDSAITKQKFAVQGTEVKNMQIEMKKDIPEQDVFYFDKYNEAVGRTYHDSDNLINISFEPALRKPGQIRLTCCPMVRSTQSFYRTTLLNNDAPRVEKSFPEALYDLNFRVDLPPENFLIAMPSPDGAKKSSVGSAFFMKETDTQRMEQVLVIISHPHQVQLSKQP